MKLRLVVSLSIPPTIAVVLAVLIYEIANSCKIPAVPHIITIRWGVMG